MIVTRPRPGLRLDLTVIVDLIEPGSRVLDLGCGTGELLATLVEHKGCRGQGVDIAIDNIIACVAKGLPVLQDNLDARLTDFGDKSFDYVILSQTLQLLHQPPLVLSEMLRVGRRAIVSIPNFAYWPLRLQLLLKGVKPRGPYYPHQWFDTPNVFPVTIRDFREFCRARAIRIVEEVDLCPHHGPARGLRRRWANLLCPVGIFVLTNGL